MQYMYSRIQFTVQPQQAYTKCSRRKEFTFKNHYYATNDAPHMQRHVVSCNKRKREKDVVQHIAKGAREDKVNSYNQARIEDVVFNENKSCFGGTLQTKI